MSEAIELASEARDGIRFAADVVDELHTEREEEIRSGLSPDESDDPF